MKSKILNIFIFCTSFYSHIIAQVTSDALRLSYTNPSNGTARSMGVSGAMGALGADFSGVGVNPAGLASFRSSELIFSPAYMSSTTDSRLVNKKEENKRLSNDRTKFLLNNFAFVNSKRRQGRDFATRNWAIGFNRLSTFDGAYYFKGDSEGSIINRFQERANSGATIDDFREALAIETGALYLDGKNYKSDFDGNAIVPVTKSQVGTTEGRTNEWTFSYAANYKEKVQIGMGVNLPTTSFYSTKRYKEEDVETLTDLGRIPSFKELTFRENYAMTGWGINARMGVILKPSYNLRLGVAAQTPTRFKISESYSNEFNYTYWDQDLKEYSRDAESPSGAYDYVVKTPWRYTFSGAYLFKKKGFLSADVDLIDYTNMAFEYSAEEIEYEDEINGEIENEYKSAVNVRLGGEYVADIFRFRAGIATLGLPTNNVNPSYFKDATKLYSFGLGLRQNKFYLDLAYQISRSNDVYNPYVVSQNFSQPTVNRTTVNTQITTTIGFKF